MKKTFLVAIGFIFLLNGISAQNRKADVDLAVKYFGQGRRCANQFNLDSALYYYNQAKKIYEQYEILDNIIVCKLVIGDICIKKGQYTEAKNNLQSAINKTVQNYGEKHGYLSDSYNLLGMVYFFVSEYDSSEIYIRKSLNLIIETKGDSSLPAANRYSSLGNVYAQKGDYKNALSNYNKDLAIRTKFLGENNPELAVAYSNLSNVYNSLGEFAQAIEYNKKSLDLTIKTQGEKNPDVAMSYFNLGGVYIEKEEFDQALQFAQKALDIRKELFGEKHPQVAASLQQMAIIYKSQGQFDLSVQYYTKSLNIQKTLIGEKSNEVAGLYNGLGQLYKDQKDYRSARKYYSEALEIYIAIFGENYVGVAAVYNNLGTVYSDQRKFDSAVYFQEKSIEISEKIFNKKSSNLVKPYLNLANLYYDKGDSYKALENFQKSIIANVVDFNPESTNYYANPFLNNYYDIKNLLKSLQGKARALSKKYNKDKELYDLKVSCETYLLCDTLIDKIRKLTTSKADKLELSVIASEIYEDAINSYIGLYEAQKNETETGVTNEDLKIAFYLSEKNKAGTLMEAIAGVEAQKFAGIPDSLLSIEKVLSDEIAYCEKQLALQPDPDEEKLYRNQLFQANLKYKELIQDFERKFPKYFEIKYSNKGITLEQMQSILDKKTLLRSYFVGRNDICIFNIYNNSIKFSRISKPPTLDAEIQKIRNLLTTGRLKDVAEYSARSYNLYRILFPDTIAPQIKNLIIIPDGYLGFIPFEALLTAKYDGDPKLYKDYPFLIKKYFCSYTYSANLFYKTFPKTDTRVRPANDWLGLAPGFIGDNVQEFEEVAVDAIPGTLAEVDQISKSFIDNKLKVFSRINKDANESLMKSGVLKDYKFLHIATHGFVNSEKPELSGVMFSKEAGNTNDGILYSGEIYNLQLNSDLVTLSACETGLGTVTKGEGIIGLSRALLYAGTKNILVSLWKVSDASTTNIMIDFYSNILKANKADFSKMPDFANSLEEAKLKMINEGGKFAHPFYWSPFILIGK